MKTEPVTQAGNQSPVQSCGIYVSDKPYKMKYPLVVDLAAAGVPVAASRQVFNLARWPHCRLLANLITASEVVQAYRMNMPFDVLHDKPEFCTDFLAGETPKMADQTTWHNYARQWLVGSAREEARPEQEESNSSDERMYEALFLIRLPTTDLRLNIGKLRVIEVRVPGVTLTALLYVQGGQCPSPSEGPSPARDAS